MDTLDNPYSPKARNVLHSPMGTKSPSRTPQSTTKRYHQESQSSENDDDYENENIGTPDRRYETSLDTSGSPVYGWDVNNSRNTESSFGWRKNYTHESTGLSPDLGELRQRVLPYNNYERYSEITTSYNRKEYQSRNEKVTKPTTSTPSNSSSIYTYILIALILLAIVAGLFAMSSPKSPKTPVQCPEFKELERKFTHQDILLWRSLKTGTENVLNKDPTQPSVFLFAHNDKESIDNVMNEIINATASCMKSKNPIKLKSVELSDESMIRDHGEVINSLKKRLEQEGIMYVSDINNVPIEAAKAFHSICDTVTPLVGRLVVFFTLHLPEIRRNMSSQEILILVEEKLMKNWNRQDIITDDTLVALIARIMDQVFLVHSENESTL